MVNLIAALNPLINFYVKMVGMKAYLVEIMPGTVMNFWAPSETLNNTKNDKTISTSETNINFTKPNKPVVVLIQGFQANGIITWLAQVGSLTKHYSVYVPDLLFFGDSFSESSDRSPDFQAQCLMKGLKRLGVERCTLVGFSYGGIVAFKMAELYPSFIQALVVSGSPVAMTDSISEAIIQSSGIGSFSEELLPTSVDGVKKLFSVGAYTKLWFPDKIYMDYLQAMFNNRKERDELLDAMIVSDKDTTIPSFKQKILFLCGKEDQIIKFELVKNMKKQLGDLATYQGIEKAGHLAHIEKPFIYNKCLKQFLDSLQETEAENQRSSKFLTTGYTNCHYEMTAHFDGN
ncbi:uncharacterized protein LOC141723514 isoform X2 [Apium graveolens]|uniref:uncharacterized protein LOC141723514 isoform X2 n=1 Tax=Apium graveolens TaxID=4045 RepID=UPI003D7AC3F9